MEHGRKLAELLGSDRESREFFASLPQGLRKRLMHCDIGNFEALQRAAAEQTGYTYAAEKPLRTASVTEMTGAIPQGDDLTCGEWREQRQL